MAAVDLKTVDPAIVKAEAKAERAPRPQVPRPAPSFPLSTHFVTKTEEGYSPAVTHAITVVVKAADGKFAAIPRTAAAKVPFLAAAVAAEAGAPAEFPFSGDVLASLVHWVEKYGADGASEAQFTLPMLHTDLSVLLASDWEKNYVHTVLLRHDTSDVLLGSLAAAEKFGLRGLVDFLVAAISCAIRGKSEADVLATLHTGAVAPEDVAAAKAKYTWLEAAMAPTA